MALVDLILRLQKGEPLTNQEMDDNLSNLLAGIVQSSCDWAGPLEPEETFPYLRWIDTSTNPPTNKIRNAEDDGWITLGSATTPLGTAATRDVGTSAGTVAAGDDLRVIGASQTLRENIKVTVGAGGDFPTINAAVLHLSRFTPDLGVTAEVELMSGFVMEEQLLVDGLNLGWITITGVDAETVINEPSLTRVLAEDHKPAFGVAGGTLPTIGQLFNFSSKGDTADRRSGVMAYSSGRATVLDGCGVRNAGTYGIHAYICSTIKAMYAVASGAGHTGIFAQAGSTINAVYANASGAGIFGVSAHGGSTVNAGGVNVSGAGNFGFDVNNGATIVANNATGALSQTKNTVTAFGIIFQP